MKKAIGTLLILVITFISFFTNIGMVMTMEILSIPGGVPPIGTFLRPASDVDNIPVLPKTMPNFLTKPGCYYTTTEAGPMGPNCLATYHVSREVLKFDVISWIFLVLILLIIYAVVNQIIIKIPKRRKNLATRF